jgi:DNA-directed RNA polymerase specialized sigma24 family protein
MDREQRNELAERLERNALATASVLREDDRTEALHSVGWMHQYLTGALTELVTDARVDGMTWAQIAEALGCSTAEAKDRYGK